MPHTAAWNEASPAGSDLASTMDNAVRDMKRDIRERMVLDHVWNASTTDDGRHKQIQFSGTPNDTPLFAQTVGGNTITGAISTGIMTLAQTWNTSGACWGLKLSISDTASANLSYFLSFLLNTVQVFGVLKGGGLLLPPLAFSAAGAQNDIPIQGRTFVALQGTITSVGGFADPGNSQQAGRMLILLNAAAGDITLSEEDAGSTAGNRIATVGSASWVLPLNSCLMLMYSGARWCPFIGQV